MQTDQDEEQSQGDGQNETEESTPEENEEMQVNKWILLHIYECRVSHVVVS